MEVWCTPNGVFNENILAWEQNEAKRRGQLRYNAVIITMYTATARGKHQERVDLLEQTHFLIQVFPQIFTLTVCRQADVLYRHEERAAFCLQLSLFILLDIPIPGIYLYQCFSTDHSCLLCSHAL